MGLKANFSQSDIENMFAVRMQRIDQAVISRLQFIAETFVNNARANGTYLDQTGNLRSSIGYVVLKNGNTISENFESAQKGTDKTTGLNTGKSYINKLKAKYKTGYVLICVAGMNYAAAVESKGRDVLTASSIEAKAQLKQAINNFKKKL